MSVRGRGGEACCRQGPGVYRGRWPLLNRIMYALPGPGAAGEHWLCPGVYGKEPAPASGAGLGVVVGRRGCCGVRLLCSGPSQEPGMAGA